MILHVGACVGWLLLHLLVAGTWRSSLAARLGEGGFRLLFSLLSALSLTAMIVTYLQAPIVWLWATSPSLNAVAMLLMLPACVLLVASLRTSNPTLAGADMLLGDLLPTIGITRVTRHPMLWAFVLWAIAHMLANGDLATLLLCAAILLSAANGMLSIDRKKLRRFGPAYAEFKSKTSLLPFAAILSGRNELRLREIGWLSVVIALCLYGLAYWMHGRLGAPILL